MQILLDTNILVRSIQSSHPARDVARTAVRRLYEQGHDLCIAPQNVTKFWNVCTRPSIVNGLGFSVDAADRHTARLERLCTVVPDSLQSFQIWRRMIGEYKVVVVNVHDARLAALMKANDIAKIMTFNVQDFARFTAIEAIHPEKVV